MPILPPYTLAYKAIASTGKNVLIIQFTSKERMNTMLAPISNMYEGALNQHREGHNFPSVYISPEHPFYKHIDAACVYVIGVYKPGSIPHELLHARFYADPVYRVHITEEWNALPETSRTHITQFLKRLGYADNVLIDEYQAYRYTEKPNFFGIRL